VFIVHSPKRVRVQIIKFLSKYLRTVHMYLSMIWHKPTSEPGHNSIHRTRTRNFNHSSYVQIWQSYAPLKKFNNWSHVWNVMSICHHVSFPKPTHSLNIILGILVVHKDVGRIFVTFYTPRMQTSGLEKFSLCFIKQQPLKHMGEWRQSSTHSKHRH
jgi:hypothetical protein